MSGILGWVGLGHAPASLPLDLMRHRGPDDRGEERYCSRSGRVGAFLGATRLAILDLSPAGHMPMTHPGCPLAIVYNGEAYNFRELRAELERAGEVFLSGTDTEVVLRGYRVWGDSVVERLRGMFAFAIWDGRGDGRLLLARDRFGQKPLYYRDDGPGGLVFSSELKALLNGSRPRTVDPESLAYYLSRGYPRSDRCLLRGYCKVLPGHRLVWEGGRVLDEAYRHPPAADGPARAITRREAAAELRARLEEAVRMRLVADVPIGALLSGGVDSASILACMAQHGSGPLRTYTACFGAGGHDESEGARRTARRMGTDHHAIMITPRCGRLLPFIASHMDEPIADASAIATYLICRRAREEVTVLLSGDGSDELLLGYPRYRLHAAAQVMTRLPRDRWWLVENVLTKVDKMSMAASVESRAPFLDPALAEWAVRLPAWARMSWLQGKVILQRAMKDRLPGPVRRRAKKAFMLPVDEWLRCEWRTLAQDVLLDARTRQRGWWDAAEVSGLLNEHLSGARNHGRRLYQLIVLELWARSLLDRGRAEPIPSCVDDCARELPTDRPVRKVAVLAPAGIGDTIRLTPALKQLGEADPSVSVTLYVSRTRGSDEVMAGMAPVDRHVQVDFEGRKFGKCVRLARDIRRNAPDQLFSTWVSRLAGLAGLLSGVRRRSGWVPQWSKAMRLGGAFWRGKVPYDPPQRDTGTYDVLAFARLLGTGPLRETAMAFASPIWEERALRDARLRLAEAERPMLAVSAAASASLRQREYPIGEMACALSELLRAGVVNSVVLLGDKAAGATLRPLAAAVGPRGLDLSGALSLCSSAAVMKACDAALVVDGALLHVALSTDMPVVALYGPTEIFSSDPRREKARYRAISVFDRCRFRCLPHRGMTVRAADARGLGEIPPGRIVEAVAELLNGRAVQVNEGEAP